MDSLNNQFGHLLGTITVKRFNDISKLLSYDNSCKFHENVVAEEMLAMQQDSNDMNLLMCHSSANQPITGNAPKESSGAGAKANEDWASGIDTQNLTPSTTLFEPNTTNVSVNELDAFTYKDNYDYNNMVSMDGLTHGMDTIQVDACFCHNSGYSCFNETFSKV